MSDSENSDLPQLNSEELALLSNMELPDILNFPVSTEKTSTLPSLPHSAVTEENWVLSSTSEFPVLDKYPGQYNFEACISTEAKPDCLYSARPNYEKIFVQMNKEIPVQFRLNTYEEPLYVRAMLVYSNVQYWNIVVKRCPVHVESDRFKNKDVTLVQHVLRCSSSGAEYHEDERSGRYSVRCLIEAPQRGSDHVTKCFSVRCLNSCQEGINRRTTAIVFTLEDERANVLGRHSMEIRICSCPKRDKDKEEKSFESTKGSKILIKRQRDFSPLNEKSAKRWKKTSLKFETENTVLKKCNLKEVVKYASDLIYRDIGMEQRQITDQEARLLHKYKEIIEGCSENLDTAN